MRETVVTLVGKNLNASVERQAAEIIRETGVGSLRVEILNPVSALDIFLAASTPELDALLRKKLSVLDGFDVFVQPVDEFRKKKLLIADMDATMIRQETLDELAAHFGLKDKVSPITEKAMRGEIDFQEALRMRVKLLKGLPVAALYETLKQIEYSSGADTLVKTMGRHGAKCVLVSGGFDIFTSHVASTLGFHRNFGNQLAIEDYKLTGDVIPPILDKHVKEKMVTEQAREFGCDLRHVIAVGDGANDIPMLKKAGTGVGYFGKPAVQEATPHQVRHTDLTALLYMQGYRADQLTP